MAARQKHEKLVLDLARTMLALFGLRAEVTYAEGRNTHKRLVVHAPDGRPRIKPLSSSPKNPDDEVEHARRWVRRTLRELGFQ